LVEGGILENKVEAYHHTDPGDTKLPEKYFELQVLANVISSFPNPEELIEKHRLPTMPEADYNPLTYGLEDT
jgi:hypothetical protein